MDANSPTWPRADAIARLNAALAGASVPCEVMDCDPSLADTAVFCEHYGVSPAHSANTIVVRTKTGELRYAACLVLATCRLDVNKVVRKRLEARKVSFASAEETREITGMEIGGVTPLGLPGDLPLWVDARIMALDYVILGGGGRDSKIRTDPAIFTGLPNCEIVEDLAREIEG